jgi:hypothetical protein
VKPRRIIISSMWNFFIVWWNSTQESITHGIPMVVWPFYVEQQMNTTMLVKEVGVAIKLAMEGEKGVVVREEIERVVWMVMEDEEGKMMRRWARELKVSAEKALNISLNGRGSKWSKYFLKWSFPSKVTYKLTEGLNCHTLVTLCGSSTNF